MLIIVCCCVRVWTNEDANEKTTFCDQSYKIGTESPLSPVTILFRRVQPLLQEKPIGPTVYTTETTRFGAKENGPINTRN